MEPGRSSQGRAGLPPFGPLRPPAVRETLLDPDLTDLAGEYGVGLDGPVKDRVAAALVEIRALPPAAASFAPPLLATALKACATRWSAGDTQEGLEAVIRLPEEFRQRALREVLNVLVEADAPALMRALRSLPPELLATAGPRVQLVAATDVNPAVKLLYLPSSEPEAVPAGYFGSGPPSPAAEAAARAAGPPAFGGGAVHTSGILLIRSSTKSFDEASARDYDATAKQSVRRP